MTLQHIEKEKKVALLSGDFNCDTYRHLSVNSALTQDFINTFSSFNDHKLFTQPTRVVNKMSHIKSVTLLDNFYTSTKNWEDGFTGILMKVLAWIIKRYLLSQKIRVFQNCLNIESNVISVRKIFIN